MRLTVSGHAFEVLPLEGVLAVVKHLGFKGVDLSGFHARGRCSIEPEDILREPQAQADRVNRLLDSYELDAVDYFPQFGASPDQHSINDLDPAVREKSLVLIRACAQFCQKVGISGMTILPGVDHPQRTLMENLTISGEQLRRATEICAEYGIKLRFEAHMGSITQTPEITKTLIDQYAPAAKVTLDYSHFVLQYIPEERIHALLPYADHVHIRPSRPGKLQTRYEENTIDWVDIIQRLKALNYQSTLSVEYVCSAWFDLNQVDTLSETAATKAALESYVGRL